MKWVTSVARQLLDRPMLTVGLVGSVAALWNWWWIATHRLQGGFDGDETSYLATAMRMRRALEAGGPGDFLQSIVSNPRIAPLTSSVSALMIGWSDPISSAMVVQPLFYVVTALGVTALSRRLAGNRAALVAGIVALGLPIALLTARSYQLIPASSAFLVLAVLALVSSDRGSLPLPMVLFGAAVGAVLVSRTVSVAFLPGLAVATAILVERSWKNLARVAMAATTALAVAAPWWLHEWRSSISPYLFRYGYGSGSEDLGPDSPLLRVLVRLGLLMTEVRPLLLVPAAIVVFGALRRIVVVCAGKQSWSAFVERHRELISVWMVIVVGWTALLTTSNIGTWFQVPLEFVAVAALVGTASHFGATWRRRLAAVAAGVSVLNFVLVGAWQVGSSVDAGGGSLALVFFGGSETIQAIDFADGDPRFEPTSTPERRREAMEEWAASQNATAAAVDSLTPRGGHVMQTFVGDVRLFQATTLELAEQVTGLGLSPWEAPTARSTIGDGTVSLVPTANGLPRVLIAVRAARRTDQEGYSPEPILSQARSKGWRLTEQIPLPDGGTVDLLTHPDSLNAAGSSRVGG